MEDKLLIVSCPFPIIGGGEERSFQVLKLIKKYTYFDIEVIFPPDRIVDLLQIYCINDYDWKNIIKTLEKNRVPINQYSIMFLENGFGKQTKIGSFNISAFFDGLLPQRKINFYKEYIRKCIEHCDSETFKGIYSHHEYLDAVYVSKYLSSKLNLDFVILLQLEPFRSFVDATKSYFRFNRFDFRTLINFLPFMNLNTTISKEYRDLLKSKHFKGFLSVSITPILISGLTNTNYRVLRPANAFESKLLKYRRNIRKKENYAVFFARFTPGKGIFELPIIWRIVTKEIPDIRLIVCGRQDQRFLGKFKNLTKKYDVEDKIILKGYVPRDELFEIVSKAKVFVYPTHSDSFSLVTLESLAVGTPVIAYDIPAIKYTYRDINAVKIVREWNTREMAKRVIDILKISEDEYIEMLNERKLINFLKLHSSWENVAKNEAKELENLLNFE
ncbi:glycosyltransferase family 4 protein [Archaeoglobus profundus]|uniref:Glycosyl transferase group 1 n=1 Tax=Archaeoglobus profundus (strain DSM 5631 / JCM 9629 / NBRC 100127 / Av18) TaxID=572546 RepID=D2RH10_ARCPA|nr:glycosyltransferase family 4 protein [Archaeoglobus profundus]ADB57585.1 glycosyl transferase group 1 [Archaeoglobus profundus DSM 5631]